MYRGVSLVGLIIVLVLLTGIERGEAQDIAPIDPARIQEEFQKVPLLKEQEDFSPLPPEPIVQPSQPFLDNILIHRITVVGNTLFHSEINQILESFFGEGAIPFSSVSLIIEEIENVYRRKGYGLVKVIIPEQVIKGGEIQLRVFEGFIEDVKIEFLRGDKAGVNIRPLRGYISNILGERPIRLITLERNLLLMNEVAGYQVQGSLQSGQKAGGVVLTLNVLQKPVRGFFEVNNWGTEAVGPVKLQTGVILNSLAGYGEQITLSGATSIFDFSEIRNAQFGFQMPVTSGGINVYANGSFSKTEPGGIFQPFKIRGEAFSFKAGMRYAWIRTPRTQANVTIGFELTNNSSFLRLVDPAIPLYLDRTRALEAGVSGVYRHPYGQVSGGLILSQGIPGLGARNKGSDAIPLSNQFGSTSALRLRGQINQQWQLPEQFSLLISGIFQISNKPLLVSEQMGIGGQSFNTAYRPSEAVGDQGYAIRGELQNNRLYRIGGVSGFSQPYLFADYGKVFRIKASPFTKKEQALASVGFGLRQQIGNWTQFQVELGFPLIGINDISAGSPQFHFSIQSLF